jgi:NitT/TauT family transport system permease protein
MHLPFLVNNDMVKIIQGLKDGLPAILVFVIGVSLWQLLFDHVLDVPSYLIPTPSEIVNELIFPRFSWIPHIWATFYETIVGFILGVLLGIALGTAITVSRLFSRIAYPYMVILQIIPKVALAPLLLIWLGYGELPKITIAFLISFFPMVINTAAGLISVAPETLDVVRSLKASKLDTFRKVKFPNSLPYIFAGLKVAITLAVIGAIVAEFVGSDKGLGYLLIISGTYADAAMNFAALTILAIMGVSLFLIVSYMERVALPWYHAPRKAVEAAYEGGG